MLYNAFFTSWPCLFTTCFEQDTTLENSYRYPVLYDAGRRQVYFNAHVFWRWIVLGLWQGLAAFFIPMLGLRGASVGEKPLEHWAMSTVSFTVIVHVVTFKLFVESQFWHWISFGSAVASLVLYHLVIIVGSSNQFATVFQPEAASVVQFIYSGPEPVFLMLFLPLVCLLPDLLYLFVSKVFFPSPADLIRRSERHGVPNYIET